MVRYEKRQVRTCTLNQLDFATLTWRIGWPWRCWWRNHTFVWLWTLPWAPRLLSYTRSVWTQTWGQHRTEWRWPRMRIEDTKQSKIICNTMLLQICPVMSDDPGAAPVCSWARCRATVLVSGENRSLAPMDKCCWNRPRQSQCPLVPHMLEI